VRLHGIATQCVAEHGGDLPRTLDGLLRLKGVGRYTAGAVACFAYGLPASMVDTNVRRVLSRVFSASPEEVDALAVSVLPDGSAYAWNQALMDLGATTCRAARPLCLVCPLLDVCAGPGASGRVKPAARNAAFAGSSRYFRGRILDALRTLPDGRGASVDELARAIASERERLLPLLERMTQDGLLSQTGDSYML
jgi:A/G-specific adenine glycosylase